MPDEREPATEFACATTVRDVAVAFDHQRVFGLDNLDWIIREIDDGTRRSVDPVLCRPPTLGSKQEFQKDKGSPFGIVSAKADPGVTAHFAGEDAIGRNFGEGSEQRVGDAEAGQTARCDRAGITGLTIVAGGATTSIGRK